MSKSFSNRFPLHKLGRKKDVQKKQERLTGAPRKSGRGERGISRRGKG